jgi:hypothetical protein
MNQIEETQQWQDFLKENPQATFDKDFAIFQNWCFKKIVAEQNRLLNQYKLRNHYFIKSKGFLKLSNWFITFMNNIPKEMSRTESNSNSFSAHMRLMGLYNSLMISINHERLSGFKFALK